MPFAGLGRLYAFRLDELDWEKIFVKPKPKRVVHSLIFTMNHPYYSYSQWLTIGSGLHTHKPFDIKRSVFRYLSMNGFSDRKEKSVCLCLIRSSNTHHKHAVILPEYRVFLLPTNRVLETFVHLRRLHYCVPTS